MEAAGVADRREGPGGETSAVLRDAAGIGLAVGAFGLSYGAIAVASGFTVLPWNYEAGVAPPVLDRVVNAADFTKPVAPGGLASVFGSQLSPMTLASTDVPLPTVLADSCLTVNGAVVPVIFVSPGVNG